MKKKVLGYRSRGNGDAVVSRYRELERIADGLYAFIYDKCKMNEDDDWLCLVFKVGKPSAWFRPTARTRWVSTNSSPQSTVG